MMKATELRIGNYVKCYVKGITDRFDTVQLNIYHLTDICKQIKDYKYEPIPLTEEWLLKFGFELDIEDDGYQKGKYKVSVSDEGCLFFIYVGYYPEEIAEFKYIHQLQNLYFALTGEELEIKDEDE